MPVVHRAVLPSGIGNQNAGAVEHQVRSLDSGLGFFYSASVSALVKSRITKRLLCTFATLTSVLYQPVKNTLPKLFGCKTRSLLLLVCDLKRASSSITPSSQFADPPRKAGDRFPGYFFAPLAQFASRRGKYKGAVDGLSMREIAHRTADSFRHVRYRHNFQVFWKTVERILSRNV